MSSRKTKTKILLDGGNPEETQSVRNTLGFLDGQTTNPTLVSKNPEIRRRLASGRKLSPDDQNREYKRIVQQISPLIGDAGVSIEVFADFDNKPEQLVAQGEEMYSWVPNAYIKYPCTEAGLQAAGISVREGIRVNMTLCFSQEQAAAVYGATKGANQPVYVSPFIGRLDDRGENGMDVVRNIKKMYRRGDGHVHVLAASVRKLEHLLYAFALEVELVTVPAKVLEEWAKADFPLPGEQFEYPAVDANGNPLKPIPYKELDLDAAWTSFDLRHDLTVKGIETFVKDYKSTIALAA